MQQYKSNVRALRLRLRLVAVVVAAFVLSALPTASVLAATQSGSRDQQTYAAAAKEFGVPENILLAVAYYQSRWEDHNGTMSADGGYGPMNLRTSVTVQDERGDPRRPIAPKTIQPEGGLTLDEAARLLNVSKDTLKTDVRQNIRGGAAVLAEQARQLNNGQLPADLQGWYPAAGRYLGSGNQANAEMFVDEVHKLLTEGTSAATSEGQQLTLPAGKAPAPDKTALRRSLGLNPGPQAGATNRAECPKTITCRYVPAAYAANSADPANYGNYDHSNRPKDMDIKYIVIHDMEGSYASSINWFQNPQSMTSAHYMIRSSDGEVTQMVDTQDTAWHAGDWYLNMHSIGIEHEGFAAQGAAWYTEAMYVSSARLVKYLAKKYDIPLDRSHILGHDNIPGLSDARVPRMHWDPGPYWDWNHYMGLITGKSAKTDAVTQPRGAKNAVTINPDMPKNVQTVNVCTDVTKPETCADVQAPANFVYLRTEPRTDAPLITDPLLHPDGAPGSQRIEDWTAKATTGQQYVVAEKQGDWTAIWFANQKAWFYNPGSQPAATPVRAKTVRLKPGLASTNMYGGAYPEPAAYPAEVPGPAQPKLSYVMTGNQRYVSDGVVPTDYFYDATIDYSKPHDHEVFTGNDKFIKIWYNHRVMFVKATDVIVE